MTTDQKITEKRRVVARSIPLAALILLAMGALAGYLGGEIAFATRIHPMHWVTAGITALLGFLAGMLIVERFGDIF